MPQVRKGQAPAGLGRDQFHLQFRRSFLDPAFGPLHDALDQVEEVAWQNYAHSRKAPLRRGPQRRHLPRRNVEDLPYDRMGPHHA